MNTVLKIKTQIVILNVNLIINSLYWLINKRVHLLKGAVFCLIFSSYALIITMCLVLENIFDTGMNYNLLKMLLTILQGN